MTIIRSSRAAKRAWDAIASYHSALHRTEKLMVIVCFTLLVAWGATSVRVFAWTSPSQLDTIIANDGVVHWKHRSAVGSDYVNAYRSRGFVILGLGAVKTRTKGGQHLWEFLVPFWLLLLGAAILPVRGVVWIRRMRLRRHRVACGLCVECGYDLRGISGRCPECGAERVGVAELRRCDG